MIVVPICRLTCLLIPLKLWQWGLQHRTGMLRQVDNKSLYVGLLPRTDASLSDKGLKVKGLLYQCLEMHQQGWFIRNTTKSRPEKVRKLVLTHTQ